MTSPGSIIDIVQRLSSGVITSTELVENSLAAIERSNSVMITCNAESARQQAERVDKMRAAGARLPRYAGLPITLKDLFDVEGEVTTAGSRVLADNPAAVGDAPVVKNLREAGFIFLGRANMSEFAFSGMGINPHYGTPLSIWDRQTGRLPGGSSSGGAVGIAEGIVPGSIGSDTAGSTRIPAAFNGIVGYKPSYGRYPLDGVYPLSPTTDAAGPMARTVECCYLLAEVMDGEFDPKSLTATSTAEVSLLLPEAEVMSELDKIVGSAFSKAIGDLSSAGCRITQAPMPVLDDLLALFRSQPLARYEAWQHHRLMLEEQGDKYDPFVRWRISGGMNTSKEDYLSALDRRRLLIEKFNVALQGYDAVIYPTVAIVPPRLADVADPESAQTVNFRCLRNTATVNYFDGCAISIPCRAADDAPVGVMLSAGHGRDADLFRIALMAESVVSRF